MEAKAEFISCNLAPCERKLELEVNFLSNLHTRGERPDIVGLVVPNGKPKYVNGIDPTRQPNSSAKFDITSSGTLTWICPSGTHRLVYRVWPIMELDKYKDSKIDLETKKEGSNSYSTRTLVKPSLVAYIKSGRGAPRKSHHRSNIILHAILEHRYLTDN
jgi:hypothetical protein